MAFESVLGDAPSPTDRLGLKIDVDTLRGAQLGVPALIELLQRHGAQATFLFALGPDQTDRWYGPLLPAPVIGVKTETVVRQTADAGFEVGVRSWNRHAWTTRLHAADAEWTRSQMQQAHDRFVQIVGTAPRVHGACGWQMNRHAFRLTQHLGFDYCTDTRGSHPFVPVVDAEIIACPQIPTTLPTFAELLAEPHSILDEVDARMMEAIDTYVPEGHVLTLNADSEGIALLPVVERLLDRLASQGKRVLSLAEYISAGTGELPRHRVETDTLPGHARPLTMQWEEFLA
jgi:peptidoglycan/xylan/chitin deacetylase (PgdA/CDA1 family)